MWRRSQTGNETKSYHLKRQKRFGLTSRISLEAGRGFEAMLSRLFQTTKALSCAVTLALLLQPGLLGCVFGCARAATTLTQHEGHPANLSPDVSETSASMSAEHACCHRSKNTQREAISQGLVKLAGVMPCRLAEQTSVPAVKQRAVTDQAKADSDAKTATPFAVRLRATLFTKQARLPDRGGTYLRCCTFLI